MEIQTRKLQTELFMPFILNNKEQEIKILDPKDLKNIKFLNNDKKQIDTLDLANGNKFQRNKKEWYQ